MLMVGAMLSPIQTAINGVITGINKIYEIMGKTAMGFVSFADDIGKTSVNFLKDSWSKAGNDITAEWDSAMGDIGDISAGTNAKLNALSANFGQNFKDVAIPALNTVGKKLD